MRPRVNPKGARNNAFEYPDVNEIRGMKLSTLGCYRTTGTVKCDGPEKRLPKAVDPGE